jgi:hypothetical protein
MSAGLRDSTTDGFMASSFELRARPRVILANAEIGKPCASDAETGGRLKAAEITRNQEAESRSGSDRRVKSTR